MQRGVRDISTGFVLILFSMFGYLIANEFGGGVSLGSFCPSFFPKFVLITLAILYLCLLIKGIISLKTDKTKINFNVIKIIRVVIYIILLIIYINLFFITGFIISTILFLIIGQYLFGVRNWMKIIIISIITPILLYYFFTGLFNIPLP